MPVHSDQIEKTGCPKTVADESRGVWREKVAGVFVTFVVVGAPPPEGEEEPKVRDPDCEDER